MHSSKVKREKDELVTFPASFVQTERQKIAFFSFFVAVVPPFCCNVSKDVHGV